jgi:carbonic anhydrase
MQPLIDHARPFGRRPEDFASLAQGQSPQVPGVWGYPPEKHSVTCSDSRVVPALTAGQLRLHGWYYEVHTGAVRAHSPDTDSFEAL